MLPGIWLLSPKRITVSKIKQTYIVKLTIFFFFFFQCDGCNLKISEKIIRFVPWRVFTSDNNGNIDFRKIRWMTSSTAEVHIVISSTLFLSVMHREESVQRCALQINENKVEKKPWYALL